MNPAEAAPTPPSGRRSQGATATTSVYDIYEKCRIEEGTHTIRLLTLLPGTKNKPISCVLSSVSLDQAHSYTALSYVWGDTKDPQPNIWIDGSPLNITRNLHTALSYIRDAKTEKRIWVDAVCINQDNDREKRDQIWQMWNIYKNAKDVVAFVGDDKNSSDLVIDYLELQDVDRGSVSSEDLKESVNSLLNRPYWTRVWIIQELAANMNVRFQCGRKSVAFLALQNFFQRWQSENYIPCGGPFWAARDTLRLAAKLRNPEQDKHDIFGVMLAATRHESSLSVDKVYGLLGISSMIAISIFYATSPDTVIAQKDTNVLPGFLIFITT
ncbi:heterokaryon incompatibility protein-domain-containing protein [Pyrenochaeta sp. MPI-SDFR-AT-0127]|nr:heterokaryon incompatibility protein-domain-containing protein [Pyrenochaeta sp. MPI-SDFR-AT-0127]